MAEDDLKALLDSIPAAAAATVAAHPSTDHHDSRSSSSASLKCCCGHMDCAYLNHNASALDGLEKDVQRAAQLGQVCGMLFLIWLTCVWLAFPALPTWGHLA